VGSCRQVTHPHLPTWLRQVGPFLSHQGEEIVRLTAPAEAGADLDEQVQQGASPVWYSI